MSNLQLFKPAPTESDWIKSPVEGITRYVLDRQGAELAKATSLVRYAPGSRFNSHFHPGGEEILVLEGTFCDEHGTYPAGSYLRNPPGTSHAPYTEEGCLLFVKLYQFQEGDSESVFIRTDLEPWRQGLVPGLSVMPLHSFEGVSTALVKWSPNTRFNPHVHPGGEEILVISGLFCDEHGQYPAGSWMVNGQWSQHHPFTLEEETVILVKTGHVGLETLWEMRMQDAQN